MHTLVLDSTLILLPMKKPAWIAPTPNLEIREVTLLLLLLLLPPLPPPVPPPKLPVVGSSVAREGGREGGREWWLGDGSGTL